MLNLGLSNEEMKQFFDDCNAMIGRTSAALRQSCTSEQEYFMKFTVASQAIFQETLLNILCANNQRVAQNVEALLAKLRDNQQQ